MVLHNVDPEKNVSLRLIDQIFLSILYFDNCSPEQCLSEISFMAITTENTAWADTAAMKTLKYVVLLRCEAGLAAGTPRLNVILDILGFFPSFFFMFVASTHRWNSRVSTFFKA